MHSNRTTAQNELLVMKILDKIAKGGLPKEIGHEYGIPYETITSLLKRYRKRHGFRTTYHMLAIYVIVQTKKGSF